MPAVAVASNQLRPELVSCVTLPESTKAAWDGTLRRKAAKAVVIVFVFIYLSFRCFPLTKMNRGNLVDV
jgi:hypothetical protein